jgi:UDP-N-acetylglucosamine 2-epimerase (non-hydrolysing)
MNRCVAGIVSDYHFAPTEQAKKNLLAGNVDEEQIVVVGNTVIDALLSVVVKARTVTFSNNVLQYLPFLDNKAIPKIVLVTGHRRENFGRGFEDICQALHDLSNMHSEVEFIYPVHLNPNVHEPVNRLLSEVANIHLIQPLDYLQFVKLMDVSYLILTDSGGIQEEAPSLGKPVLVMRDKTERPEAVDAGTVKLVGTDRDNIVESVHQLLTDDMFYKEMSRTHNPYGDGKACMRIKDFLLNL